MNQNFDITQFDSPTYRLILGIAEEQPLTNWYDVLGVAHLESDERVLEDAIVSRIGQARRYEVGGYQDQALIVLEEVFSE